MDKEAFKQSVRDWTGLCAYPEDIIKRSERRFAPSDENLLIRLGNLYSIGEHRFAPILAAVGQLRGENFRFDQLVFDSPQISDKDHESFSKEIAKRKEKGLAEPLFVDLNYCSPEGSPIIGFRLFDKGDGKAWVKVINCSGYYIKDTGEIYYCVKDINDGNDMNILISTVADYFLDKKRATQPRVP